MLNEDVIVLHRPKWVRDLVESIDLHIEHISPLVDDVDRAGFIASIITTKLETPDAYFGNYEYVYKTSAFNTRASYKHFELFDDMINDIFMSDETCCITDPIIPLIKGRSFRLKVDTYMGVITIWIER